jgi:hypothetical protein
MPDTPTPDLASSRGPISLHTAIVYAATFFIAVELELVGTGFGNWAWAAAAPAIDLPAGNPPLCDRWRVLCSGCCGIEGSVISPCWFVVTTVAV